MEDPPTSESHGGSLQFSLRGLLILTAVVAVACSLLFASPGWVRMVTVAFFCFAFPTIWLIALIHGRGYLRTFAIGALCSGGVFVLMGAVVLVCMAVYAIDGGSWKIVVDVCDDVEFGPVVLLVILFGMSIFTGLLAVTTRWLIESSRRL